MDRLAARERQKYERLWSLAAYDTDYRCALLTPVFLRFFHSQISPTDSVIDFGCGSGQSVPYLLEAGLKISLVDFCENSLAPHIFLLTLDPTLRIAFFQECLWDLSEALQPADWILSFDVLEHIPEHKVDEVLRAMAARMKKGGLLSISLQDDVCGKLIGEKLHLTVKPLPWWEKKISRYFTIERELADHAATAVLAVRPKAVSTGPETHRPRRSRSDGYPGP